MDIKKYYRSYRSYSRGKSLSQYQNFYDPEIEGVNEVCYADIHDTTAYNFIEVPYCTYSDYSCGTVERSNNRVFLKKFGDKTVNGKRAVWAVYGGYNTCAILIRKELYETDNEVKELIDGLDDYPLFDDEDLSNLEMEIEDESWDSWIKFDLKRALNAMGIEYEDDDKMHQDYYRVMSDNNIEVIFEDAVSCYVKIDDVIKNWKKSMSEDKDEN